MKFGILDIITENKEDYFVIKADYDVELIIKRIVPSHATYPLRIRVHPENTRIIRMVMKEYPLEIKTNRWNEVQEDILKHEEIPKLVKKLDYVEPDNAYFIGKLFPFQKQGLDFILKTDGKTLVTDEMGLGKTIEALAFISKKPEVLPVIVVAPLVTLINWKREIQKFLSFENTRQTYQQLLDENTKRMPVVELIRHGIKEGVEHRLKPADFYIINYELVDKRHNDLIAMNPKLIIYDEIQSLRNEYTKKYSACKSLGLHSSVRHRIGLSGTPIYNKGIEMFNICEVIKAGLLGDKPEFIRRYCMNWNPNQSTEDGKKGLSKLLYRTIMIRRKKIDVLKDLPEKIRMKQEIPIDTQLYESEIEKLYERIEIAREQLSGYSESDQKEGLFELNKKIREMTIAERQIAGLAKVPHVIDYLNNLLEDYDEEKFVVFCHHKSVHKALFDGLWRYNPVKVIGGQSDKERQEAIDSFQTKKEIRVIICGLRAGNLGINLTSSAYVIFAELDWSPSIHRQAEDRLHRIGQKHKVFAHYLEGIGTFDEILSKVLLNKTLEISSVLGDKIERLNNKKAVEFLESKFQFKKPSKIAELITDYNQ